MMKLGMVGEALREKIKEKNQMYTKDELAYLEQQGFVPRGIGFASTQTQKFVSTKMLDEMVMSRRADASVIRRSATDDPVLKVVRSVHDSITALADIIVEQSEQRVDAVKEKSEEVATPVAEAEDVKADDIPIFGKFKKLIALGSVLLLQVAYPIYNVFKSAFAAIGDFVNSLKDIFTNKIFPFFTETIPAFIDDIKEFFTVTIPDYFNQFMTAAGDAISGLLEYPGIIVDKLKTFVSDFMDNVTEAIGPFLKILGSLTGKKPEKRVIDNGDGTKTVIYPDGSKEEHGGWGIRKYDKKGKLTSEVSPRFAGVQREKFASGKVIETYTKDGVTYEKTTDEKGRVTEKAVAQIGAETAKMKRKDGKLTSSSLTDRMGPVASGQPAPAVPPPAPAPAPAAAKPAASEAKPAAVGSSTGKEAMIQALNTAGITDPVARAAIMAQVGHESGGFKSLSENLNYRPATLLKIFPKYFKTKEDAETTAKAGPEAIANRVYGGRMGNAPDEGFKYRGRGFIQLTGKNNYKRFGYDSNPDQVATAKAGAETAIKFMMGYKGDWRDVKAVTKFVNGGYIGLEDRKKHFEEYLNDPKIANAGSAGAPAPSEGGSGTQVASATKAADIRPPKGGTQVASAAGSSAPAKKEKGEGSATSPNPTAVANGYKQYFATA